MSTTIRALFVEDSEDDAARVTRELKRGGFDVQSMRVDTEEAMREALKSGDWQLVLSDWHMPEFSALGALRTLQESGCDIPFIILSGTISEEVAVEAMKAGAHDFLNKQRLSRLVPAVERELRDAGVRRERSRALERVRASEQNLAAIFNQVAVGIIKSDAAGRIVAANAGFCAMTQYTPEEVAGLNIVEFIHPDEYQSMTSHIDSVSDGLPQEMNGERRIRRKDGSFLWISRTMSRVVQADGAPHAVTVIQDISDLKRAEEGLRQAVRARDEFISIASHELKTPMTSLELQIASTIRLFRKSDRGEEFERAATAKLDTAARQVDRLAALVNSLLDVTRITSGKYTLVRSTVDLAEVVTGVAGRLGEYFQRAQCELTINAPMPVRGRWDAVAVETVVSNLLSNAAKFGAGKRVDANVSLDGDRAVLRVQDHGIGIQLDEQQRIFERFERAVPSQHYAGFGIGLWVARQVVDAHRGSIRVESAPGMGSTFTVELPCDAQSQ